MGQMRAVLALLVASVCAVNGVLPYQNEIPNGANVPGHPGVGHVSKGGAGALNPFGVDFAAAGHVWTKELCEKDSDGDGYTNGEELGDPYCTWPQTPAFDAYITHPGVASNEKPVRRSFCDEYEPLAPSEQRANITMPSYSVPTDDTTYAKYAVPVSVSGYMTKFTPIVDQLEVVHHMLIYACRADEDVSAYLSQPQDDGQMPCARLVYVWAVGGGEFCLPKNTGLLIDTDVKHLIIEIHYDNPSGSNQYVDSSGVSITYTASNDLPPTGTQVESASWQFFGAVPGIKIPPGKPYFEVAVEVNLPPEAALLYPPEGIEVFAYFDHAHKLSRRIWATVKNPGEDAFSASCSPRYDFEYQEITVLGGDFNFRIKPGATITVHCEYDSTERSSVTLGSDATDDEMCVVFFLATGFLNPDSIVDVLAGVDIGSQIATLRQNDYPLQLDDAAVTCGVAGAPANSQNGLFAWVSSAPAQVALHAWFMMATWFLLVPAGTMVPLLFKRNPANTKWFLAHKLAMSLALLLSMAGIYVAYSYKETGHFSTTHGKLGLAIVALAIAQGLGGALRPHKNDEGEEKTTARQVWETAHPWAGRLLVLLAAYQLVSGFDTLQNYAGASNVPKQMSYVIYGFIGAGALFSISYTVYSSKTNQTSSSKQVGASSPDL